MMLGFKSPKAVFRKVMMLLSNLPMPGHWRWHLVKLGGVIFTAVPEDERHFVFIGENVIFDSQHPEDIEVGNFVHITTGCVILSHYMDVSDGGIKWKHGRIEIGDHVFLGANTIITKPLSIGRGSIIGAGSVLTKDVPPNQIWAGNPARYIKERPLNY